MQVSINKYECFYLRRQPVSNEETLAIDAVADAGPSFWSF